MLSILSRFVLALGVLVALTPCGVCHGSMGKASPACSMKSMSGKMDCCHKGNPASPICKVMDQASTAAVSHGLEAVPAPVVSFAFNLAAMPAQVSVSVSAPLDTSPLRAPLALRI
ncbi:MAG TPA: hypothetical protein VJ873_06350 [bacterium]|nr:hypothetical protein [bacterium]